MRIVTLVVPVLATLAYAGITPVGNWKGHVELDKSKFPTPRDANETKKLENILANAKQMKFTLILRQDKSFTFKASGGGTTSKNSEGTWKMEGQNVMISPTKVNGKPVGKMGGQLVEKYVFSKDGQSLTISFPQGKAIFARG